MFRLDTEDSDTDTVEVFIDLESVFDPEKKKTVVKETPEGQTTQIELSNFMNSVRRKKLSLLEMLSPDAPSYEFHESSFSAWELKKYAASLDLSGTFRREIRRRLNKLLASQNKSERKNYNQEQEYDSKYAAHLFRVVMEAFEYQKRGYITFPAFDDKDFRAEYLAIKTGYISRKDVFLRLEEMSKEATRLLEESRPEKKELPFPHELYYSAAWRLYENTRRFS